jgi:hypothetical protein
LRQALSLIGEFFNGRNRPAEEAQPSCNLGIPEGSFCAQLAAGPDSTVLPAPRRREYISSRTLSTDRMVERS